MINAKDLRVSASTAFFGRSHPDVVHFYAEAGIDAMEVAGMNVNRLAEYDLEGIKAECDKSGVELRSVHLPFSREQSIAHPEKAFRDKAVEINKSVIDRVAKLGVKFCVIHPSSEPNEDPDRPHLLGHCEENLHIMVEFAKQYGMDLALENLPRTCLCNTSAELIEMLRRVPDLKTCFDLNHFLPWKGVKPDNVAHIYALKREVGERLISLHVSDYDFVDERHQFPMDGDNDWQGIVRALEDTDYAGCFNYEISFAQGVNAGKTLHDLRANFDTLMALGNNKA